MLFNKVKKNYYIFLLILFSVAINQYFGNRGVFPVDSFAFFDTGFRVLNNQFPFKDYWVVSGPFIDFFQSILFFVFGVNWQAYILHASILNALLTVTTFIFLKEFKLRESACFFYSICFAILAYPTSGTPFVDHHSAFFSILTIYFLILGIKNKNKKYWYCLPFLFGFAFLSKQVPAFYFFVSILIILILYFFNNKKNLDWIKSLMLSSISFILLFFFLITICGIKFSSFIDQYLLYPITIGEGRYQDYQLTFKGIIHHFKFIYIAIMPYLIINIYSIINKKKYFNDINFYKFLGILFSVFSLILHQILTKNQTYIFFLIPLVAALSHTEMLNQKIKFKNIIIYLLLFLCVFTTIKYNKRFNIDRKFHELNYVDFNNSKNGKMIDEVFEGLKWITPEKGDNPLSEINLINDIKIYLENDNRKKMLITNYSFFSIILKENLHSPNRWYPLDGSAFPVQGSKFFNNYKKFFISLLKKNNIDIIYVVSDSTNLVLFNYVEKSCFTEKNISLHLTGYLINKNCKELNNYN